MDDMEEKIESILNNPNMMQQIMSMAQALGGTPPPQSPPPPAQEASSAPPGIDPALMHKLALLAQNTGIDKREQALLQALGAYLSRERIGKLEKAMRAAKMARLASSAFSPTGR